MNPRTSIVALAAACLLARGAFAQTPATASNPVGVWRGTSLCRVRPSPCKDEVVVYRITRVNASDSLLLDGRRIVKGQEEEMGVLGCRVDASGAHLTCRIPNGVWRFTVRGDSLVGELRSPDNRKYRDVNAARVAVETKSTPSADGTPISYAVTGHGDPAMVFVHGWAGDQSYWRDQVSYFAPTHLVITLDLAGHGSSGRGRSDWSIQRFGEDVAAVVRATGATKVVLIGHSLGGPVVVEAALQLPDQTMGVVGVDTFFDAWSTPSFANRVAGMRADFIGATTGFVRRTMFNAQSDTALASRVTSAMAKIPPEVGIPAIASLGPWASTRSANAFAALRVPLGTIQRSAAGHTELERARPTLTRLDANVMAGPGHFLMLEDPARFNVTLDSLVRRLLK